jgi:Family of unknown function (DUF6424)
MTNSNEENDIHEEHGDYPWTRRIPDHPPRRDSSTYRASRKRMNEIAESVDDFVYGEPDYEDHHGGGLWLKDEDGWFLVRNVAGIEWSGQFCADPEKVDMLRLNARRLYARFPEAVEELGIRELLDTPITDLEGVSKWTDAICNASVPLPAMEHRGVLPKGGGIHHYPTPVAEIAFYKYDDFQLWVTDDLGNQVAVVPHARRGSGDGRVDVIHALPAQAVPRPATAFWEEADTATLTANDRISQQAFGDQYAKLASGAVDPSDPLSAASLPGGGQPEEG